MIGIRAPWLVTSATLPDKQRDAVLDSLHIEEVLELKAPLDRPNLYYNIIPSDINMNYTGKTSTPLDFIVDEPGPAGSSIPLTLIYFDNKICLSLIDCGTYYGLSVISLCI